MDFIELKCQRCGGALEEKGGTYVCKNCGKKWKNQTLNGFTDMLQACEEAIRAQRVADIANLRQLLWKETHNEYVSNIKVSEYCTDILKYLPQDFYANFYLATCAKNKNALGDFLSTVNLENHYDDIELILDYVLKALKTEWVMGVSSFIEKIKDIDMAVYNKYRTWFEQECEKVEDGVFEAELDRDVFLAYSSADMPKVIELVNVLEKNNITCFVAARNMRHGSGAVEKYNSLLHTAIDHCAVLVFVSSDNSRNVHCDAYSEEISYIIAHRGNMPRVEYLIQNYSGRATERNFRNFFNGLEYCTAPEDVAARVADIIMKLNNEPAPKPKKTKTPKTKAQPAEPVNPVAVREDKLKRAKMFVADGNFAEAIKLYEEVKNEAPDDMEPYIGLIRTESRNYTVFEGEQLERYINSARTVFKDKLLQDADYRLFAKKRAKVLKPTRVKTVKEKPVKIKPVKAKREKTRKNTQKQKVTDRSLIMDRSSKFTPPDPNNSRTELNYAQSAVRQ